MGGRLGLKPHFCNTHRHSSFSQTPVGFRLFCYCYNNDRGVYSDEWCHIARWTCAHRRRTANRGRHRFRYDLLRSVLPKALESSINSQQSLGLAWMQTNGETTPSLSDLHVFKAWPQREAQKVPSKISYSKAKLGTRAKQWGYSIDAESLVMQWTKLELDLRSTTDELLNLRTLLSGRNELNRFCMEQNSLVTHDSPLHICKSAEDIMRDFIAKIAKEWWRHMRSTARFALERVPMDLVITHPAVSFCSNTEIYISWS